MVQTWFGKTGLLHGTSLSKYAGFGSSLTETVYFVGYHARKIAVAGTLANLSVTTDGANGTGLSSTYVIQKNGVDTALAVTITGAATHATDLTHSVHFAETDTINLRAINDSGVGAVDLTFSIAAEFTPDTDGEFAAGYVIAAGFHSVSPTYWQMWTGKASVNDDQAKSVCPIDCTLKSYYVDTKSAPGGGKSLTFHVIVDGVVQDGTGGTVDTSSVISGAGLSASWSGTLHITTGQTVQMRATPTGTPTTDWTQWGFKYEADTPGQWIIEISGEGSPSDVADNYETFPGGFGFFLGTWASAETNRLATIGPVSDITFGTPWIHTRAGGGNTWTFKLRVNEGNPVGGPVVTVTPSVSEVVAQGTGRVTATAGSTISLLSVQPSVSGGDASDISITFGAGLITVDTTEPHFSDGVVSQPLTWIEFTDRDDNLSTFAEVDLNDRDVYYGGYKAPKVLQFDSVVRGLSDRTGQVEHMTFGAMISDTDLFFRGKLGAVSTRYITNRPLVERMIDDEQRRVEGVPRIIACGYVADYSPAPNFKFKLTGSDWLKKKFLRARTAAGSWQRKITTADFLNANAQIVNPSGGTTNTVGAVGKGVPVIYGKLDDSQVNSVEVPTITPSDPSVAHPTAQYMIDVNKGGGGVLNGWVCAAVCAVVGGVETDCGTLGSNVATYEQGRSVRIFWEPVAGASAYHIYFSDHGGYDPHRGVMWGNTTPVNYVRQCTHDNVTLDGNTPTGMSFLFENWSDGTDVLAAGTTTVTKDTGKGAYKPLYVGDYVYFGETYRGALICGHAATLIGGYLNDQAVDLTTSTDWLTPLNATQWAAAGFTHDHYVDMITGNRFFMIFLKGTAGEIFCGNIQPAQGSPGITVNVWGVEDVGDGSGTTITNGIDQYKHFCLNYLAATYTSGNWATTAPEFPAVSGLEIVDRTSFDNAKTVIAARLSGGYEGCGVIGFNGELVSALDVLSWFNQSFDVDSGFNRKGQYMVSAEPSNHVTGTSAISDVLNINNGGLEITDLVNTDFFNIFPYKYSRDYTGRVQAGWSGITEIRDETSITLYDQERESPSLDFQLVRDLTAAGTNTINDVIARRKRRFRHPRRKVRIVLPFSGLSYEIGDVVPVTTVEGIGADGWTNNNIRLTRHEVDPTGAKVTIEGYDMEQVLASGFILGNRSTLAASWPSASTADRVYGYLGDRSTGTFSTGDPAKVL